MKAYLLIAVIAFLPTLTLAQSYKHSLGFRVNELKSIQGLSITIKAENFETGYPGRFDSNIAEDINIAVQGGDLRDNSRVRAVITNHCKSGLTHTNESQKTLQTDLSPVAKGFALTFNGNFEGSVLLSSANHNGDWFNCQPQLSVVVDGIWQVDPVNGSTNFNLVEIQLY